MPAGKKWRRSGEGFQDRGLSSSSSGGLYVKPKKPAGCYCSIGRTEKGEDAALITLGSIGIPLAIAGVLFGGSLGGGTLTTLVNSISTAIQNIINQIGRKRSDEEGATPTSRHLLLPILTWPTMLIEKYYNQLSWAGKAVENAGRSLQDSAAVHLWKVISRGFGNSCGRARGKSTLLILLNNCYCEL